jgi:hypothetical protein
VSCCKSSAPQLLVCISVKGAALRGSKSIFSIGVETMGAMPPPQLAIRMTEAIKK